MFCWRAANSGAATGKQNEEREGIKSAIVLEEWPSREVDKQILMLEARSPLPLQALLARGRMTMMIYGVIFRSACKRVFPVHEWLGMRRETNNF